jgi:hypothetical protein
MDACFGDLEAHLHLSEQISSGTLKIKLALCETQMRSKCGLCVALTRQFFDVELFVEIDHIIVKRGLQFSVSLLNCTWKISRSESIDHISVVFSMS